MHGAGGKGQAGRDPFDAVPVRNERAEAKVDDRSCAQIRMRPEPGRGLVSRLLFRLGLHRDVRVDLDLHGSRYWALIDGRRSLGDIERQIRAEFALDPEQSRQATIQFTKLLMLRHLVLLDVRQDDQRKHPVCNEETAHAQ